MSFSYLGLADDSMDLAESIDHYLAKHGDYLGFQANALQAALNDLDIIGKDATEMAERGGDFS